MSDLSSVRLLGRPGGGSAFPCPRSMGLLLFALALSFGPALPQAPPASPVRYTEAREHAVRQVLRLPGTVESRTASLVATEVEGVVEKLLAREGQVVREGEPLARLRTTHRELHLGAAQAQLKEAGSRLKLAEVRLNRARELYDSKVSSQQQLDDALYERDAWQGRVEQLEAEIKLIEDDIARSVIRAPFAGTVIKESTDVGEWIAVGGPVVTVASLDELEIRVQVPERYFRNLSPAGSASVTFESLPDHRVEGKVGAIIPQADPAARTFPVKVRIRNPEGRIGVGMLAQVLLPTAESYRATVVPKDAVVREGAEQVIYLINGDKTVARVPVATGLAVGSWIAVEGEIRAGQKVVTRGNERLRPGQPVRGEPVEYTLP